MVGAPTVIKKLKKMGLAINKYSYRYSILSSLRRWALTVENNKRKLACFDYGVKDFKGDRCGKCIYCALHGNLSVKGREKIVKFYEFIDHSDSDGGYISFSRFGIEKLSDKVIGFWGDLDQLKSEIEELDKHTKTLNEKYHSAWKDFREDVFESEDILRFE